MRVLISRTDRIGDLAISIPAIKAVRDKYPDGFIAVCVSPNSYDLVKNNPFLNDIIILDKENKHRGISGMIKFIFTIAKRKFDVVFVLNHSTRVHLAYFLAGIPKRIGYDKKWGNLLTGRIPHDKQKGEKHEMEYTLDLLRASGIEIHDKKMDIYLSSKALNEAGIFLGRHGISKDDKFIAIHPGSSCPSKKWPIAYFTELSNRAVKKYGVKVVIVGDKDCMEFGKFIAKNSGNAIVDLTGKTSVEMLACVIKKSSLLVSNDSGPVHVAVSVGTPVISIFGRNDKGLSPTRWRPLGPKDMVFHKEVGCTVCLAHNCKIGFKCLRSITVDEVMRGVEATVAKTLDALGCS